MDLNKLNSIACRIFFFVAFVLLAVSIIEKIMNVTGHTILRGSSYTPSRFLEFAIILLIFVIALLMRQVRELLRKSA
ncbi:MAG: hypothetical protein JSV33_13100 [bacterium]|nr:MAG: hypothetical protein JSV33_13100 [bacterium]